MTDQRCGAYVWNRTIPLARGGVRHLQCKRMATQERKTMRYSLAGDYERTVCLCSFHANLFDNRPGSVLLSSDPRR